MNDGLNDQIVFVFRTLGSLCVQIIEGDGTFPPCMPQGEAVTSRGDGPFRPKHIVDPTILHTSLLAEWAHTDERHPLLESRGIFFSC